MFLNFRLCTFLFPALLLVICNGISDGKKCYIPFPKFANPQNYNGNPIYADINSFYQNFDERYRKLEEFIKRNMDKADNLDVRFYLFTRNNRHKPDQLHKQSLNTSNFNPKLPIKVIVHGLRPLANFKDTPVYSLKHALLERGNYNVIVVTYYRYARVKYTKALKFSFLVAKNAADNLKYLLKTFKLTAKRMHLIAFGFGGQVAANIGHHMPGLARLTALDPAGALFDRFPPKYRISPDDAVFVDVILTSTEKFPKGLGFPRPAGGQNFFPNGGKNQPGCPHNITAQKAGSQEAADFGNALCDHKRSLELFIESVCDTSCSFVGIKCDSYKDFENRQCLSSNSAVAIMGFHAKKNDQLPKHSKFYLNTNSHYPYCKPY